MSGGIPDDLGAHEHIAGRVAQQVSTRHRIDNELYREGQNTFETTGLFDIATLIGVCYSAPAIFEHIRETHDDLTVMTAASVHAARGETRGLPQPIELVGVAACGSTAWKAFCGRSIGRHARRCAPTIWSRASAQVVDKDRDPTWSRSVRGSNDVSQ